MKRWLFCLSASAMLLISSPAFAQHPKTVKAGIYDTSSYGLYHR